MTVFKKEQIHEAYPDDISDHYWTRARYKILTKTLLNLGGNKILDYGCGDGGFVNYLQNKTDFTAYGYEPAPYKAIANPVYKKIEDIYEENFANGIQIISLLDVIEHIDDPKVLVNEIIEKFKNLRHIIITVPARKELWSNYDEHYGHKLRYNRDELLRFCSQFNKFEISYCGYFFHLLYVPALGLTRFTKRNTSIVPPKSKVSKIIHRILAWILFYEWKIISRKLPGTSLIITLTRKGK